MLFYAGRTSYPVFIIIFFEAYIDSTVIIVPVFPGVGIVHIPEISKERSDIIPENPFDLR